jgi:NitT/TauT family transport system ATP-binding protein
MTSFIKLDQVGKTYHTRTGSVHAVAQATFGVRRGEFVSLLGPSGCGKSTLLMMVAGLETPSSGALSVDGQRIDGPRKDNGIIFQDATLLPWKSVLDNVLFPLDILKLSRSEFEPRARQLIQRVGLGGFESKKPHELSGGMRQRVAICRALIHDPQVLLMDEPFSALDAITRDQMNLVLADMLQNDDKTVLFVTHSIREAVYLSDRVLVMGGRPSTITLDLRVDFPRPRAVEIEDDPRFREMVRMLRASIQSGHGSVGREK